MHRDRCRWRVRSPRTIHSNDLINKNIYGVWIVGHDRRRQGDSVIGDHGGGLANDDFAGIASQISDGESGRDTVVA